MADPKLLGQYGLKYNPFLPSIPAEDLWRLPGIDAFFFRIESLVLDGGFALITGEPGLGKSKALQLLASRLGLLGEVTVGVMERPQSTLGDFYRELGELFNVNLTPTNRYGGFKALRERWRTHIKSTLCRPVLLIDEAQEVDNACLSNPSPRQRPLRLRMPAHDRALRRLPAPRPISHPRIAAARQSNSDPARPRAARARGHASVP